MFACIERTKMHRKTGHYPFSSQTFPFILKHNAMCNGKKAAHYLLRVQIISIEIIFTYTNSTQFSSMNQLLADYSKSVCITKLIKAQKLQYSKSSLAVPHKVSFQTPARSFIQPNTVKRTKCAPRSFNTILAYGYLTCFDVLSPKPFWKEGPQWDKL